MCKYKTVKQFVSTVPLTHRKLVTQINSERYYVGFHLIKI